MLPLFCMSPPYAPYRANAPVPSTECLTNPLQPPLDAYDTNLNTALPLIASSIQGERDDELFYDDLIRLAPSQADKDIIASIRNDERRHRQWFRYIYYCLTGQQVPEAIDESYQPTASYLEGLEKALFGELSAVEKYRRIYFTVGPEPFRNIIFEILTDELKHASKYNFLYAKNK
ncbi:ferritin-like domain-containing protein [Paenibacillus profundus]|uniref:Ferritin-like domain-containing protein n=1 Tax=Paenibacillus profundus TaxID=1173085 RepID=A0ABS8YIE2_9BACL|nr:ferritin-like domain-containing protein [Paenibacillus profundus]MCE5170922.1 ferritin-like domain-containing protein [Paenibacillus profundus]